MKSIRATLALVAAIGLTAPAAVAQVPSLDARVNLRVAEQNLEDVVANIRARSGANIVIVDREGEEPVSKSTISIELLDVPWRDALELVAEQTGAVVEERQAGVLAVTRPERVTLSFQDVDIREVIETIATASGANVVIGPKVTGPISVRFRDVPWREALDVVSKTLGFVVVEETYGVLRVVDPLSLQDQLVTKSYQLRYLRPRGVYDPIIKSEFLEVTKPDKGANKTVADSFSVLKALRKALSQAGDLDYIETANVVVVRDTAQVHDSIREMLTRLDVEPLQVFCDVKFVSTANTDVLNLGVDYGDSGPSVDVSLGAIPITLPFDVGDGGWDDYIIASPDNNGPYVDPLLNGGDTFVPPTVYGSLDFTQVSATLRLLQRDTKTEVIQAPKIVVMDGDEATIFVGETIRYAEAKSEQGQAGGLVLSLEEAEGSPVEIGFQLALRPNVIPGTDKVVMEIIPKETSLSGTGSSALAPEGFDVFTIGAAGLEGSIALPRTRASTIVTSMMLENGQTAVIGGLTQDSETKTKSAVPGLSKIPILGYLFKHKVENRARRSLMVFVTPTLVRSSEDTQLLLEQEIRRRRQDLRDELEALINAHSGEGAQ